MSDDFTFSVMTERAGRAIAGTDSTILWIPEGFYVDVDGKPALVVQVLSKFLRGLAEKQAADIGEELHHGEFVITTNPATVQAYGLLHDCEECRATTRSVLRSLAETPDRELIVGQLFWAAPS